jgi:hypothetical protein
MGRPCLFASTSQPTTGLCPAPHPVAGFFDRSEYEEAKRQGQEAIRRMILRHLQGTTVTVVLIGNQTAYRPWVQYEVAESVRKGNGLLGIYIHHLQDRWGYTSAPGPKPSVPTGIEFPACAWDGDLWRFAREIEAAGQRHDNSMLGLTGALRRR